MTHLNSDKLEDLSVAEIESVDGARGTIIRTVLKLANRALVAAEAANLIGPVDVSKVSDPMDTKLNIGPESN